MTPKDQLRAGLTDLATKFLTQLQVSNVQRVMDQADAPERGPLGWFSACALSLKPLIEANDAAAMTFFSRWLRAGAKAERGTPEQVAAGYGGWDALSDRGQAVLSAGMFLLQDQAGFVIGSPPGPGAVLYHDDPQLGVFEELGQAHEILARDPPLFSQPPQHLA